MKALSLSLLSLGVACSAARAEDLDDPAVGKHHFGFGVPTWIGARARFTAVRATSPGANPGTPVSPADGRVDRTYDDGFNRVNQAGNPVLVGEPRTSYFAYQNQSQVSSAGTGNLALHSIALNGGDYSRPFDNQPLPGIETHYRYDRALGRRWRAGWELAFGYSPYHWEKSGAPNSTVSLLTDQFNLSGVPLSTPGVAGPFTPVPGTTYIGSTPTRTETTVAAAVAGKRQLDLHALQFRIAPMLVWEPVARWQLSAQAGLLFGVGISELRFAEQITVADPTVPTLAQSGRSTDLRCWAGGLSALRLNYQFGERWEAQVEARHLWVDPLRHNGPTRAAEVSLGSGYGLSAGLTRRF